MDTLGEFRAETSELFSLARLLLIFVAIRDETGKGAYLERLSYYHFFAEQPYLLFPPNTPEWIVLVEQGVELSTLGYASSPHRFVTRREQLRSWLSGLVGRGLIVATVEDGRIIFKITESGVQVADRMQSMYADDFALSARLVIKKLKGLSEQALVRNSRAWLDQRRVWIDM